MVGQTLAAQAPAPDDRNYPGALGTTEMNLNALEHIAHTSVEQGVHSGQPRLMKEIAERGIAEGHGGDNYMAVFEILKRR
ncbi:hypothetical protein FHR33_004899 [Nonomuraea dietziae]|uniref:NADPH-dependent reductive aminase-like C-terminal domain-containing protein n=1 Tax=Nonomuraea dietziae TaxID=65515 RepID=A0A7W5YSH4_9ACTN|nr:hypothetical protein [Nonomuraea dietziae]MBB3729039.1 hypothetical protein [Nonomuraea dietziae]